MRGWDSGTSGIAGTGGVRERRHGWTQQGDMEVTLGGGEPWESGQTEQAGYKDRVCDVI